MFYRLNFSSKPFKMSAVGFTALNHVSYISHLEVLKFATHLDPLPVVYRH